MRYFLILLLLLPLASAQVDFFHRDSLTIDGWLENPVEVVASGRSPKISSLEANLSWFPRDDDQVSVLSMNTNPLAEQLDNSLLFSLKSPDIGLHSFDIGYRVQVKTDSLAVRESVPFPLQGLTSSLISYLDPTETIDITPDIRDLASDLAGGETDAFVVVSKIARWTKENIEYNLSTAAVEASQPSSWVLENRQGVCDELTNLFISMVRSLGIPAKFVSGLAFTNSELFDDSWGAHGWAEVFFPGVGWVPFDVTYGQLGWVDATHVKFSSGFDSGKYASSYSWRGRDVEVVPQGMELGAKVVSEGGVLDPLLKISTSVFEESVAPGSYNVIFAEVSNPTKHYVADDVSLAMMEGVEVLDPLSQVVILSPGEKTSLSWIIKVSKDLESGFIYTFPTQVYSQRGAFADSSFSALENSRLLSQLSVEQVVDGQELPSEYADDVSLWCATGVEQARVGEDVSFACEFTNEGSLVLRDVELCLELDCQSVTVQPGESVSKVFTKSFDSEAVHAISFSAKHKLFDKFSFVYVTVGDEPVVAIKDVVAPESINFDAVRKVTFTVDQEQGNPVSFVEVSLSSPSLSTSWVIDRLTTLQNFDVAVPGSALILGENEFKIRVSYVDDKDTRQSVEKSFSVELGAANWWQTFLAWFRSLTV